MRWTRRKYEGKNRLGMPEMKRRFCGQGWRFAQGKVVFTGASSVTVKRYRYRGSNIPTPLDPETRSRRQRRLTRRERHVERPVP
jgi:RNA-directed DNA polymerase